MFRIGTGFDVHAFEPGNKIYLCGVEIPFDRSLAGHSDADVALHALTDAILGALALGDIGLHFPDTDEKWKNADSIIFLNWSIKQAEKKIGVIAQEVEKVLPEVVLDGEYKSVAYGNMVGVLIEAFKELKTEIDIHKQGCKCHDATK